MVGEPGIGKSRLSREFARAAKARGAQIILTRVKPTPPMLRCARCRECCVPCSPSAISMRGARKKSPSSWLASSTGLQSSRGPLRTAVPRRPRRGDADDNRGRATAQAARAAGRGRQESFEANGFIVEDLHWVDAGSDEFLAEFAATLTATKSIFVGTFRPDYHGRLRDRSDTTIRLTPLSESTTVALAAELIGEQPTALGAAELIAQPSAGNPFFVEEIVRDLVGRHVLRGNRGGYQLAGGVNSIAVPPTVQAVLGARIDRLASGRNRFSTRPRSSEPASASTIWACCYPASRPAKWGACCRPS